MRNVCRSDAPGPLALVVSMAAVAFGIVASTAAAAVTPPTVTRPPTTDAHGSPSRNYPFLATDLDLAGRGFIEEEFFFSGMANRYDTPALVGGIGLGPATGTANVVSSGHPYKTRMVVRRPVDAGRFNGVVVVEWINTTSSFDTEALWFRDHEFFIRDGYAWVGISVQDQGISRSPNGLKVWSPARYGTLDVTDSGRVTAEGLSYDVYAQGMQAVRSNSAVLGGLTARLIIAAGVSQSAGRLALYLNSVHHGDPVADAALLIIGGQMVRTDLGIPVIKALSETEYIGPASANQVCSASVPPAPCGTSMQADSDKFRLWGMAGVSHSDWQSGIVRNAIVRRDLPNNNLYDMCTRPSRSRIQDQYHIAAAIDALKRWVETGIAPAHAPPVVMVSTSPTPQVARDANGNMLGGMRLASFAVPVAMNQGDNAGPGTCFLNGTHVPFDKAKLAALYPSHAAYVNAVTEAADHNISDGFLLPADANELVADAAATVVGTGLTCGPLCANVAQFPLNPSTQNLRDQTEYYYFVGGQELVSLLDQATLAVAQGYTHGEQGSLLAKRDSFAEANGLLHQYIDKVKAFNEQGRAARESAALLVEFANTLIERITAEGLVQNEPLVTPGADGGLRMVEFYRSDTQQFFWGTDIAERTALDRAATAGGWTRSGASFTAWLDTSAFPADTVRICRFYGAAGTGPISHFLTADAAECEAVKANPRWIYEGIAFRAVPAVDGACRPGLIPVMRLWKPGTTVPASRHRFVVDQARAATLVTFEAWTLEGVAFCVLSG